MDRAPEKQGFGYGCVFGVSAGKVPNAVCQRAATETNRVSTHSDDRFLAEVKHSSVCWRRLEPGIRFGRRLVVGLTDSCARIRCGDISSRRLQLKPISQLM